MHEPRILRPDMLGQMGEKGDHIMLGDGFNLVNSSHIEFYILGLPNGGGVFAGDHAKLGLRIAGMGFDLIPDAEFGFGRPNGNHFRAGIAGDHGRTFCNAVSKGLRAF